MNLVKRSWLVVILTLFVGAGSTVAQSRISLVQGRRSVQDQVTFVVEVVREQGNPRYLSGPDCQVFARFTQAVTGKLYLDGNAVGRFDGTMQFNSNPFDISLGRHTLTLAFASPAVLTDFYVTVRSALTHEILDDKEPVVPLSPDLSQRVAELEQKVHDLETEVAALKKKRNH